MSEGKTIVGGSVSSLSLLGIVFITLKLCGVIAWSWWLITAPFWAVPAFVCVVLTLWVFISILGSLGD